MNNSIKGYLLAAIAAAAYGTNPAFAVPLYEEGMNPNSVLLFRYLLGIPLVGIMLKLRGIKLSLRKDEIFQVGILGVLMAFSSLALFESYNYLNAGVASTLLFVYPILVAVLMVFIFHEPFRVSIIICLLLMTVGLMLLMKTEDGETISSYGVLLVLVSAVTYALYIIMVNVSKTVQRIPTTKLLFYVLLWGSMVFVVKSFIGTPLTMPEKSVEWLNLLALALIPTVVSLLCTTIAINLIGSTPTAIFGSLEPVSAVILSYYVLHQTITGKEIIGGALIVLATTIVIGGQTVDRLILSVRKMWPKSRHHSH